jgi:hypothetical protein
MREYWVARILTKVQHSHDDRNRRVELKSTMRFGALTPVEREISQLAFVENTLCKLDLQAILDW